MTLSYGFEPIISEHAKILILGSIPGVESLQKQQYYAHPRNAFWHIVEQLINIDVKLDYLSRINQLKQSKIALWDVVASCRRMGSLDSNIATESITLNPIDQLIASHDDIICICLNGRKAFKLFKRHFVKSGKLPRAIDYVVLPSTSPANARLDKAQKCQIWREKLEHYL